VIGYEKIQHAGLTDVGIRRSHNQDAFAVLPAGDETQWRQLGYIFVVADGMGGHAVGELASQIASSIIPHTYQKHAEEGPGPALHKAIQEANISIHARGQQNQEFAGMGTTSTALLLRPEGAWIGHVGDSRVYRIRGGQIEQLSFDHSWVWEMARRQGIRPQDLQPTEQRNNVIVRSLGPDPLVEIDLEGPHTIQDGDIFVLCSDGLSGQVSDNEIGAVAGVLPPAEACRFLVNLANLRGGPDNITVVIVRVGEEGKERSLAASAPGRKSWLHLLPWSWPVSLLVLGLILAAGAVRVAAAENPVAAIIIFVLAAAAILAGLTGLGIQYLWDKNRPSAEESTSGANIYRHGSCQIDRPLLDKLMKAEEALTQRAREKQWEVDWQEFQTHHDQAETQLRQENLVPAFREFCRAMIPLTNAMEQYRNKEEIFQPLWDRVKRE
jgi:protein phosphatase